MYLDKEVDFILSHFEEPLFPRKMMVKKSGGQFSVYSKDDFIKKCIESDNIDCRINAYPEEVKYERYNRVVYPPNFIFIDLDLNLFSNYKDPRKMLDKALKNTLEKISEVFSLERSQRSPCSPSNNLEDDDNIEEEQIENIVKPIVPTVLWSGNGYHIYLPIQSIILDNYDEISKDKFPSLFSTNFGKYSSSSYSVSEVFLLFAKQYLSCGKDDPQHRPNYKTCLIRIPNTYNSKCLGRGLSKEQSKVLVIQRWNGYRPPIQLLTREFWKWLIQEEINQKRLINRTRKKCNHQIFSSTNSNFKMKWIEDLLQKGIADGRKETLRLILGPYLAKRKNYDDAVIILQNWLDKCNELRLLDRDFYPNQKIKSALKNTKGYLNLENLKNRYPWLYRNISLDIRQ